MNNTDTNQAEQLNETVVKSSCSGQYYNFKKGLEICSKKDSCKFYNKDYYNHLEQIGNKVKFERVHQFRLCQLHLSD